MFDNSSQKSTAAVIIAVLGMTAFAVHTQAQDFGFRGQSFLVGVGSRHSSATFRDMGEKVYAIDHLADQMVFRYGWELRYNRGCKDSIALYKQMQRHAALTNDLIRAYRGTCGETFQKAACEVHDSLACLENLRRQSRVSEGINRLMTESRPVATYIYANANHFHPIPASGPERSYSHRSSGNTELTWRG